MKVIASYRSENTTLSQCLFFSFVYRNKENEDVFALLKKPPFQQYNANPILYLFCRKEEVLCRSCLPSISDWPKHDGKKTM